MKYITKSLLGTCLLVTQLACMQQPQGPIVNRDIALIRAACQITENDAFHVQGDALIDAWNSFWARNPEAKELDLKFEAQLYSILETDIYRGMFKKLLRKSLQSQYEYLKGLNLAKMFDMVQADDLRQAHMRNTELLISFIEQDLFFKIAQFGDTLSDGDKITHRHLHQDTVNFVYRVYRRAFLEELAQGNSQARESATKTIGEQLEALAQTAHPVTLLKRAPVAARAQIVLEAK